MSMAPSMTTSPTLTAESVDAVTIDKCTGCGSQIALRPPTPDSPAIPWICLGCGSVFFARPQEKNNRPHIRGTRLVAYTEVISAIDSHLKGKPNPIRRSEVQRLVECLAAQKYSGSESRRQKRFPVAATVTVMPLGPDFRIIGQPMRATTLNVSGGGCAIVQKKQINEPYLAIDFDACGVELLPAVLQVTRTRPLGPVFEVAGRFLSRILQA